MKKLQKEKTKYTEWVITIGTYSKRMLFEPKYDVLIKCCCKKRCRVLKSEYFFFCFCNNFKTFSYKLLSKLTQSHNYNYYFIFCYKGCFMSVYWWLNWVISFLTKHFGNFVQKTWYKHNFYLFKLENFKPFWEKRNWRF